MPNLDTSYTCQICSTKPDQKSHIESHISTSKHQDKRKILELELKTKEDEYLMEKYGKTNIEEILKDLEMVKDKKEKKKIIKKKEDITNFITTREALKDKIHQINNFLRNNGAGYGMNSLKVFNIIYGLNRIEKYNLYDELGINKETTTCKFSKLLNNKDYKETNSKILKELLDEIYENPILKPILYYEVPRDMKDDVFSKLLKMIKEISDIEDKFNIQLSGKVYEYFIGRDDTAISELGAYFTDRHITDFIYNHVLEPTINQDGSVKSMIDMFGGSGGFTVGYAKYIVDNYNDIIDKKSCIDNIYHYDMNSDVIKSAALELLCITNKSPNMENNIHTINSFSSDFSLNGQSRKFHYIVTNPPYGGDKTKKTDKQIKRDKVITFIKDEIKKDKYNNEQIKKFDKQIKDLQKNNREEKTELDKHKVIMDKSSSRIQAFANKYGLKGNDKESVSLVLMMELLEEGGTAVGVLKEGVFFNKSYKALRECLVKNFNVRQVISVPSDQFENTSTKTSIVVFDNTEEKTSFIQFGELKVDKYESDNFEIVDGIVRIVETKDEIKEVYNEHLVNVPVDKILENKSISLNGKDYNKREIIPGDNYELVKLGDITSLSKKNFDRQASYGEEIGNYNFYTSSQNIKKKCISPDFNKLSIIIGSGGVGSLHLDDKFSCSNDNFIVNSKGIDLKFVYFILTKLLEDLKSYYKGSTLKHLSSDDLTSFEIPIPKSETKIKEWTDKIYKPYNDKISKKKELEELEKEIKDRIQYISENEECDIVELDDVCEIKCGINLPKNKAIKGNYKVYGGGSNSYTHNDFNIQGLNLLVSRVGNNNVSIINEKILLTDNGFCIKSKDKKINTYLCYYMLINKKFIYNLGNGSAQKVISKTNLKSIKLKIPKNKKLITSLEPNFQRVETLQEEIKNAENLFNQYIEELGKEAIKN